MSSLFPWAAFVRLAQWGVCLTWLHFLVVLFQNLINFIICRKEKEKEKKWLVWNVYSRFTKEERNSVEPNLRFFQSPFLNSSDKKKCWFLNKNSTQWVNGGRFSFTVVVAHLMIVPGPFTCTSILSTEAIGLLRTNWKTLEKSGSLETQVQLTSFYTGMMIHVFGTLLLIP